MAAKPLYKVIFINRNNVFELYAKQIYQSDLYGFVEIEELVFNEKTQVVVDPSEEKLKTEFAGVQRSYIPIQSIIRIDEVEKRGAAKVTDYKGGNDKVATFPGPGFMPSPTED